jgi:hypothetical protein
MTRISVSLAYGNYIQRVFVDLLGYSIEGRLRAKAA